LLINENKVMETAALPLKSLLLSSDPATVAQPRTSEQTSGEFAKVLYDQTSPENDGKGQIPNKQEQGEDSLPATGGETVPLPFALMPVTLPVENNLLAGKDVNTGSCPVRNSLTSGEPSRAFTDLEALKSIPVIPLSQGVVKDPRTPGSVDEPLKIELPGGESFTPEGSMAKDIFASQVSKHPLSWEKIPGGNGENRSSYEPEKSGNTLSDLPPLPKGGSADFNSGFLVTGEDLISDDLKSSRHSKTGSQNKDDISILFDRQMGPSLSTTSSGAIGHEKPPALAQTQKFPVFEQIGQKVAWSLNRHEEQFRLTLDPPQLGSIYIEIQREKEHIKATLWAENPNTKSLLEANQLSIQKIIEKEGFSLESFDVFVEQNLGSFQESRERKMNPESSVPTLEREIPRETIRAASSSTLPSWGSRGLIGAIDLLV